MNINDVIFSVNPSQRMVAFQRLLSNARCEVTFYGKRVIVFADFEETLGLNEMVVKVIEFVKIFRREIPSLSIEQRRAPLQVIDTLERFYHITDNKIIESNFLIQGLSKLSSDQVRNHNISQLEIKMCGYRSNCENTHRNFLHLFKRVFLDSHNWEDIFYYEYDCGKAPIEVVNNDITNNIIFRKLRMKDLYSLSRVSKTMNRRLQPFINKHWPIYFKGISCGRKKWFEILGVKTLSSEPPVPQVLFDQAKILMRQNWKTRLLFIPHGINNLTLNRRNGSLILELLNIKKIKELDYNTFVPTVGESFWILMVATKSERGFGDKDKIPWKRCIQYFLSAAIDGQLKKNGIYKVDSNKLRGIQPQYRYFFE